METKSDQNNASVCDECSIFSCDTSVIRANLDKSSDIVSVAGIELRRLHVRVL